MLRLNLLTAALATALCAAAQAAPDGIVVPKISSPDQLEQIGQRLLDLGSVLVCAADLVGGHAAGHLAG